MSFEGVPCTASAAPENGFSDAVCDLCRLLMLPEAQDHPPGRLQHLGGLAVACHCVLKLPRPELGVGPRPCPMYRAGMPEAAINEYGDLLTAEHQVGSASQRRVRTGVHPISQPEAVHGRSNSHFRTGVAAGIRAHRPAGRLRGRPRRNCGRLLVRHTPTVGASASGYPPDRLSGVPSLSNKRSLRDGDSQTCLPHPAGA